MLLSLLLILLVTGLTWVRLVRLGSSRLVGAPILISRVPLLARIRMHVVPAAGSLALAVVLAFRDNAAWWMLAIPLLSGVTLFALPVHYTITETGIRLGWTRFRRWTEFAGVRRAPGGARLAGVHKARGMHIWLSGSRGDDEFLQFLRQMVRGAYKGTAVVIPFPSQRSAPASIAPQEPVAYAADR